MGIKLITFDNFYGFGLLFQKLIKNCGENKKLKLIWFGFIILGPDVSYYNGAIVTSPSGTGVILTGGEYPTNPYYSHTSHQMMELGKVLNKCL